MKLIRNILEKLALKLQKYLPEQPGCGCSNARKVFITIKNPRRAGVVLVGKKYRATFVIWLVDRKEATDARIEYITKTTSTTGTTTMQPLPIVAKHVYIYEYNDEEDIMVVLAENDKVAGEKIARHLRSLYPNATDAELVAMAALFHLKDVINYYDTHPLGHTKHFKINYYD